MLFTDSRTIKATGTYRNPWTYDLLQNMKKRHIAPTREEKLMGYYVTEVKNKQSHPRWKVQFVSHKKEHTVTSQAKKPKKEWDIPKDRWQDLGFLPCMDIATAKCHARQLNSKSKLKIDELRRIKILEAQKSLDLEIAAFLPEVFTREFETRFILKYAPGENSRETISHWRTAQKMLLSLKIDPSDWFEDSLAFYDYFYQKHFSLSYLRKILRIMNLWGFFVCKKTGKPFLPVPSPAGHEKKRLLTAYYAYSAKPSRESAPIIPSQLNAIKQTISPSLYNWIYISVWLGLRPLEVDNLKSKDLYTINTADDGTTVLWIYQTKLIGVPPLKRWKPIPLLFKEQKEIIHIIQSNKFHRPLVKTMRRHFSEETTLYGGRKGFADLMLSRNQSLENIAQWMGHATIERTWRNYKNRRICHYHPSECAPNAPWAPNSVALAV